MSQLRGGDLAPPFPPPTPPFFFPGGPFTWYADNRRNTYVIFVDLDADVEHLTIGVGIGVVAADDFSGARERRLGHVVVVVVGRAPDGSQRRIHAPAQHAQCQQTCKQQPKNVISPSEK